MDAKTVIEATIQLIRKKWDKINIFFQTSGGWEGWLQCELFLAFEIGTVMREVDVWGDGRACDLLFEKNRFIVELKCLGWGRIQTSKKQPHKSGALGGTSSGNKKFVEEVLKDQAKIQQYQGMGGQGVSIVILPRIPSDIGDVDQIAKSLTSKGYAFYPDLDQAPFMLLYFAL